MDRCVRLMGGWILAAGLSFVSHTALAQGDAALIAKGEKVYADKKCSICHMLKGKGGKTASDLSAVGAKREASWLKQFMKDPKGMDPKAAKMLPFKGSEEELEALVAYMASLK